MPSAIQLRAEADALYARAASLRKRADDLDAKKQFAADQRAHDRALYAAVLAAERGASDDAILARLAAQLNGSLQDARGAFAFAHSRHKALAKAQRNRLIMQQAWKGWTNAQIGDRVGPVENTVSRIVAHRLHREEWK
jgi:DNA-binding NarL/FixJ family response regulator